MELNKIRDLATLMKEQNLEELRLTQGEDSLVLKRPRSRSHTRGSVLPSAQPADTAPEILDVPVADSGQQSIIVPTSGTTVKSPMVGMFYGKPSPEAEPFVTVGQQVSKGDVLCIIEAMKLMNEITAEQDGIVTQVYPRDGQLVEFDQILFHIEEN